MANRQTPRDFVHKLGPLLEASSSTTVRLTFKRYDGRKKPRSLKTKDSNNAEYKCLVRCSSNSSTCPKLTTVLGNKDVTQFQADLAHQIIASVNLQKRDKAAYHLASEERDSGNANVSSQVQRKKKLKNKKPWDLGGNDR
ncbi:hypothetical protein ACOME3_003240 [Neoechinorhynchus agilis]